MSSPDGPRYSQAEFLARWLPSSERAGVILNSSPDLAGSSRFAPVVGSSPMKPDDSFVSDFAPLTASADSSCLGADGLAQSPGGGVRAGNLSSVCRRTSGGEEESLDESQDVSQDVPLMMKLEQLRKWQQHMQEQLKAHQLQELLRLQQEQQRLLGMMNGCEHSDGDYSESSELSGAEEDDTSLQRDPHHRESPPSNNVNPTSSACGLRKERQPSPPGRQEWLSRVYINEEVDNTYEESTDDQEQREAASQLQEYDDTLIQSDGVDLTDDHDGRDDEFSQDRPIKPGIGGRKQTFEELLEEQLRLEDQRLKSAQQQQTQNGAEAVQAPPKRAFLKRGEGLSRFTNNHKASFPKKGEKKGSKQQQQQQQQPQARTISRSNSEPAVIQRGSTNRTQRVPVQRKTATLNKENRLKGFSLLPQDIKAESKTARTVLGSYHRQNTEGSEPIQNPDCRPSKPGPGKEQNNRTVGLSAQAVRKPGPHNTQPNPVTKQVGMLAGPGTAESRSAQEKESTEGRTVSGRGAGGVLVDSFQEKMQHWESDQQRENMELGEFELLEQAAGELSFSSNSSFVMKFLQKDQQQQQRQLQAAQGRYERRLSSTPIKSPPRGEPERCVSVKSSSVNPGAAVANTRDDSLENKMSTEDQEQQDIGRKDKQKNSDVGFNFKDQEVVGNLPSNLCFPALSNPPYDKWSYQDEDGCRASDVTQDDDDDGESDSVLRNSDESTLIEQQPEKVVFDDDDTWNNTVETLDDSRGVSPVPEETADRISPPVRTVLRKVATSKVVELDTGVVIGSANQEPEPPAPPPSQLMTRLFPSLKPKVQNLLPPPSEAPEPKNPEEDTGQQVHSRQVRERLAELEITIARFKKENAVLTKLRLENEKDQELLRRERLELEQTRLEEMAKFEEYKKEENKKLQKERKLFEKHVSAARAIPDKKEREEIQALKQQLSSTQEELRRKESRWASTHGRLRQQIDSLSQENSSLREEILMLEKLRLSAWKKNPVSAEKDKEATDSLRISANSVSSVTKGVKFASPLASRGGSVAAAGRRSSAESGQGMKSSLRRPSGPCAFSSSSSSSSSTSTHSLSGRRTEEKPTAAIKSQDKLPNQEPQSCSPKSESQTEEPESSKTEEAEPAQEVITHPDGKIEHILRGGDRLFLFPNGTKKEVSADGLTFKVTFFNGDTKQVTADQRVIYYYSDAQTTHITYPDGLEVLHFSNDQTEKHFPDGRKEITFPDQTVQNLFPDGREENVLTDGTIVLVNPDGSKEINFNTGQKEIHTAEYKKREYPDGTVKTVYADGRQETCYPTGRLRIKDKDGNVVLDNRA